MDSVKMKTEADFADSLEYHKELAENYREAYAALKVKADSLAGALRRVQGGIELRELKACRHVIQQALADYRKGE